MAHLGELLAELRQDRGLTQDQLAEIITFKKRMHKSLWRSFMSWTQKISIF